MKSSLRPRLPHGWPDRRRLPANHVRSARQRLLHDAGEFRSAEGELARDPWVALVEAALMAADEPLTTRRLAAAAGVADGIEVRRLLRKLEALYEREGSAFQVEELAGGFQLLTRPEFHPWLSRLRRAGAELRLSPAMRETLAIIAYRQPIMRADIEAVRGVHCGEILRQLMEKGLVRIAGRDASLGRPVLYGTTRKFLQMHGLRSLKDLPRVDSLRPPGKKEAAEPS